MGIGLKLALAVALLGGLMGCLKKLQPLEPEKLTSETFLMSDFTEEIYRTNTYGYDNAVLLSMRDTLLRLYPPGTHVQEFCDFFERVVQSELKRPSRIEDQDRFTRSRAEKKYICAFAQGRQSAIAEYRFDLNTTAISANLATWILCPSKGSYFVKWRFWMKRSSIFRLASVLGIDR